ncbi:hypothetical protein SLEP1_g13992 [Rubroshorea leprosula]|uniref:Uncharacterized protein n=1 Tax=Rubroshorea leprosula TaxID=152421 RepID=A0AAV5IS39_9ROSI|nr:hypothetical protein SLEP1_g13992 [Rubroshorea leprosula]
MYIDPIVPWNHKTIDCLAEIILRYYGFSCLEKIAFLLLVKSPSKIKCFLKFNNNRLVKRMQQRP